MQTKPCKWENRDYFLYPDCDPYDSQYLMESKLDQGPCSNFFEEDPNISVCVILQTNSNFTNTSVVDVANNLYSCYIIL